MTKWHKGITKAELKHIKVTTRTGTLAQFKGNIDRQRKWDAGNPNGPWSCSECANIARKLGL